MSPCKLLPFCVALALTGCSLAPDYQRPAMPVPQQFSLSQNDLVNAADNYQNAGWRTFFVDNQVKTLISEALVNNRDLRMATLKVQEARAQYRLTDADRYPQLNGEGSGSWSGNLKGDSATTREFSTGLNASFDLDFFGRLKNMSEAERQNYLSTEEAQRAVHILLVSNVAQSYFNQQLAYAQLQIAEETLRNYQQSYAFVEKQLLTGSSNVLALEQARGVIESTRSDIAKRQGELAQANNALQLLLGSYGKLPQAQTVNSDSLQSVKLPAGLSSQILLQRPDIMEAEHALIAANANIGAARAAFFPSISLTSGISTASSDLSSLFNASSGMWNFIPKIEIPIFNAGRNQANLDIAEIRQQQSVVNYEQKTQNAFKEVADALALRQSLNDQISAQQRYLASLQITLQRARALYQHGAVSYLEVLDAERSLFATRQTLLDLNYARQVNEISLYTALGGGWQQ
ncbi:TPA: Cu(+)/Ag(+) efflux RND transporter outer membrane channel CusC [Escherichia coli]|nr:Cu(+)/Ag(+) efflux RND transporter outer membrane channel CusC [Escherichia coli]HBA7216042.1 Cu(+)/Ag(+) efflux RND transporter outer membrane channel CusC [Escherichia coli]